MPHSISPETTRPDDLENMDVEAPTGNQEAQTLPDAPASGSQPLNGSPQVDEDADSNMVVDSNDDPEEKLSELPVQSEVKLEVKPEVKLEELFADVESDEEFPSSTNKDIKASSSPEAPSSPVHNGPITGASDTEVMRSFYQRVFPWRYLFQWLNHSPTPSTDFGHREFSLTLPNDVYLRYMSYPTADLLRKDILRLMPTRFEIGPVYSSNPRDRKTLRKASSFKPIAKELVFDIDMTDYDDIRTCCDKANICIKCWQFITMAIKVMDVALRDDFGFKHILWVYSGRRGAHAWICDKRARQMSEQKRRAIAGYLTVVKGGAQGGKRVNIKRPLHPHVARSLDILKSHFQSDVLHDQDPWETDERSDRLLQLLPDRTLNDALRKKWSSAPGRPSTAKWADIDSLAKSGVSKTLDSKALLEAKQDVLLEYTYPRLDIEVSKQLHHLLKSPFVIHPGTGRVCVPINPKKLGDFDPFEVPTVMELLTDIDEWTRPEGEGEGKPVPDWEKTRLKPYVEFFRSFIAGLMRDEQDIKVKRERDESAADAMEF